MRARFPTLLALLVGGFVVGAGSAVACGGFFCQSSPVDQTGERIVFTANDDGTITSLVEILYEGSADDFSWILPIPEPISADDVAVPEDGQAVFDELHELTDVQIIPPAEEPDCALVQRDRTPAAAGVAFAEDSVEVFASGEVGPFGFEVIGSDDPSALIDWLRTNDYRVEQSMEPLIDVYVQEEMAFIAMRLLDGEDADSIEPVELTYPGTEPMIPLRLTAVAAQPDMPIFTWIFGDQQAVPSNTAHIEIETAELTFGPFGNNDYRRLVADRSDANEGRAFITEFAGAAADLEFEHDYLTARTERYLTRLFAIISPDEMTVDPAFHFEDRADVSNVRDASQMIGLYDCQRFGIEPVPAELLSDALDPRDADGVVLPAPISFSPVDDSETVDPTGEAATADETGAADPGPAIAVLPTGDGGDGGDGAGPIVLVLAATAAMIALGTVALRPRN